MLTKILGKIDRFYLILAVVVLVLGGLIVITLSGVLSAISTTDEVDEGAVVEYGIDQQKLDEAYDLILEKSIEPLDLGG